MRNNRSITTPLAIENFFKSINLHNYEKINATYQFYKNQRLFAKGKKHLRKFRRGNINRKKIIIIIATFKKVPAIVFWL